MPETSDRRDLSDLISELQEEAALELAGEQVADGTDPMLILDLCHRGMIRVGEYYERGRYFISGLIMAGEIMCQIGQMVLPLLESKATKGGDAGSVVLGTVEGDIHFIGKDIFKVLVRGHGFTVHDLGVDVPPGNFLAAIHEFKPDIVGLSCLISAAFSTMGNTITFLRENVPPGLSPLAYVIGGRVDEIVCRETGADSWANDAMTGVRLCQEVMEKGRI
jgi:methanogenic corrinoid protein MtbC1